MPMCPRDPMCFQSYATVCYTVPHVHSQERAVEIQRGGGEDALAAVRGDVPGEVSGMLLSVLYCSARHHGGRSKRSMS